MIRNEARLIKDPPLDGPTNMGRDEALMLRVGAGASPPTLRLYQWDPPTISLGYFQPYADYEALPPPAGLLPVVRRPTGGGAILHDLELTYSLTLPVEHPLVYRNPNQLYELAHDAIIACLRSLGIEAARCGVSDDSGAARGPFFCFERRHCYDLLIGGDKVAGSAQRRTRQAILQHGSIVLANRFPQHPTALLEQREVVDRGEGDTEVTPRTHGSHKSPSGRAVVLPWNPVPPWYTERLAAVIERLPHHFSELLRFSLETSTFTAEESALADSSRDKFGSVEWTQRM